MRAAASLARGGRKTTAAVNWEALSGEDGFVGIDALLNIPNQTGARSAAFGPAVHP